MGLVYNPIHNRKDNNGNNTYNEINDDTSRVYNCNARCNRLQLHIRTSHVRFNDKLCRCGECLGGCQIMPNKHFCQGPDCHTRTTQDRFLKSRGVVRGRYASLHHWTITHHRLLQTR